MYYIVEPILILCNLHGVQSRIRCAGSDANLRSPCQAQKENIYRQNIPRLQIEADHRVLGRIRFVCLPPV